MIRRQLGEARCGRRRSRMNRLLMVLMLVVLESRSKLGLESNKWLLEMKTDTVAKSGMWRVGEQDERRHDGVAVDIAELASSASAWSRSGASVLLVLARQNQVHVVEEVHELARHDAR